MWICQNQQLLRQRCHTPSDSFTRNYSIVGIGETTISQFFDAHNKYAMRIIGLSFIFFLLLDMHRTALRITTIRSNITRPSQ